MGKGSTKGFNHGVIGIVMFIFGVPLSFGLSLWYLPLVVIGIYLVADEIQQYRTGDQYGGLVHDFFVTYFYHKYQWVRDVTHWFDRLFGKDI